jgi:hypothetical protein
MQFNEYFLSELLRSFFLSLLIDLFKFTNYSPFWDLNIRFDIRFKFGDIILTRHCCCCFSFLCYWFYITSIFFTTYFRFSYFIKWAASRQNQRNALATSMDPDQPALPRSLIRIHAVRLQTQLQVEKLIANSMDPDQTARMRRLVWIHARREPTMLVLSWHGSIISFTLKTK